MAPHIQTPVEGFTGVVAGVNFANGVGDTDDPAALEYFARQGYDITPHCPPGHGDGGTASAPADGDASKGLSPKQKLQAEAAALGLDTEGTKDEIAARIAEHKADAGKDPAGTDGSAPAGVDTPPADGTTPAPADGGTGKASE